MTDYEALKRDPLAHLDYFTEWGGRSWERLVRIGLVDYLGGNLEGKRVLEIGARYGKMSCLFGLLGAHVTGVDIHQEHIEAARAEARQLGVDSRVEFFKTEGNLEGISGAFDIVFTKSVLVLVPDLKGLLISADFLLNVGGRVVFIENGRGGPLLRLVRRFKHRGRWDYSAVSFIAPMQLRMVESVFEIERTERSTIPPIYLLCGRKRLTSSDSRSHSGDSSRRSSST